MALTLRYATAAQLAAAFRARYLNSSREECARLATWLLDHIDAGDFTDAQVRIAFGLTQTQYDALKTRMIAMRNAYNAVQSASGE